MSEESDDKDHAPTQKRLDEARARGDVPRSADLTAAAGLAAFTLVALWEGPRLTLRAAGAAERFLASVPETALAGGLWAALAAMLIPLLAFLLIPAAASLVALAGQHAITFAPEKLRPRLSRVSPLANARQRFGSSGLVDFARSALKLVITALVTLHFLADRMSDLVPAMEEEAPAVTALMAGLLARFLILAAAIAIAFGVVDYLWQRFDHQRRNRMSRQELTDEFRESEGDPHIKGQRRQRAQAIATNRMIVDVAKADVVIVNPTHYAVALRWNRKSRRAPICVAKGVDHVAARIREAAALAGIPVHADPPTARVLFATVEIGAEVRPDHYAAVAAAIRYAERMRQKVRERGGLS